VYDSIPALDRDPHEICFTDGPPRISFPVIGTIRMSSRLPSCIYFVKVVANPLYEIKKPATHGCPSSPGNSNGAWKTGEDSLMVGCDYTHRDSSMEYEFPRLLKERAEKGEITQSPVQKILYGNAKTFYGL
jgi:hypothetical protein